MADDMGWSDIAANGVRFTQFYNTGRCCPTRATLLTGTYAHQAGIGHMMGSRNLPGYKGDLNKNVRTIAEVLKGAGYATYMAGKWHVTPHIKPEGPKYNWPRQRGFDRFYGTIHGAGSFFDPNSLTRENTQISPLTDKGYQPNSGPYYYTDAINDHADVDDDHDEHLDHDVDTTHNNANATPTTISRPSCSQCPRPPCPRPPRSCH